MLAKQLLNGSVFSVFSDEKNFDQHQEVCSWNDMRLCVNPAEVPVAVCAKFPAIIVVFGVVSSEGYIITPPLCFPGESLGVNADAYLETPQSIIKPLIDIVANEKVCAFQQCHKHHSIKHSKLKN